MKKWGFSILLICSVILTFSCRGLFNLFDDEDEEEQKIDYTKCITLSGSYSSDLKAFNLSWVNNSYKNNYVYIWVDNTYSGKVCYTSALKDTSCTGYKEGTHSVVLKNGNTDSSIIISNTISITITKDTTENSNTTNTDNNNSDNNTANNTENNNTENNSVVSKTPKEYWGTWIRMDTGERVYQF